MDEYNRTTSGVAGFNTMELYSSAAGDYVTLHHVSSPLTLLTGQYLDALADQNQPAYHTLYFALSSVTIHDKQSFTLTESVERNQMSTNVTPPPVNETVEHRLTQLENFLKQLTPAGTPNASLRMILEFIGVGVLGSAIFFVGTMYSTVNHIEKKVDKLIEDVTDPKDSLSPRLVAVETRLMEIDKKLDEKFPEIDRKLDAIDKKLTKLTEK